jgi:hypothetical protein
MELSVAAYHFQGAEREHDGWQLHSSLRPSLHGHEGRRVMRACMHSPSTPEPSYARRSSVVGIAVDAALAIIELDIVL